MCSSDTHPDGINSLKNYKNQIVWRLEVSLVEDSSLPGQTVDLILCYSSSDSSAAVIQIIDLY